MYVIPKARNLIAHVPGHFDVHSMVCLQQGTFVLRPFWWPMNMKEMPSMEASPHTMAGSSSPALSPCSSTNLQEPESSLNRLSHQTSGIEYPSWHSTSIAGLLYIPWYTGSEKCFCSAHAVNVAPALDRGRGPHAAFRNVLDRHKGTACSGCEEVDCIAEQGAYERHIAHLSLMLRATSRNVGLLGCLATCSLCTGVSLLYVSLRNCRTAVSRLSIRDCMCPCMGRAGQTASSSHCTQTYRWGCGLSAGEKGRREL